MFAMSPKFWYVVFSFSLALKTNENIFSFPLGFLLYCWLFKSVLLNFTILWIFQFSFCYWFLTSARCGWRKYFVEYLSFKIHWDSIICPVYDLSWKMSHLHLKIICILLSCRVFYICLLDLIGVLWCLNFLSLINLSGPSIHHCKWGIEVSNCYFVFYWAVIDI